MDTYPRSPRNEVRRLPARGHYDQATIFAILDQGFLCHLGYTLEGQPFVIPTAYGRDGDIIYVHGSVKSRTLKALEEGIPVCLTVTHLDGLVLARSAFHHSMNYRSAVIFGTAREITDPEAKHKALFMISEQILRGRWDEVRQPTAGELAATSVLAITIEEASAKIREGAPKDDRSDYDLPIWAGVVPTTLQYGSEIPDVSEDIPLAESVRNLKVTK